MSISDITDRISIRTRRAVTLVVLLLFVSFCLALLFLSWTLDALAALQALPSTESLALLLLFFGHALAVFVAGVWVYLTDDGVERNFRLGMSVMSFSFGSILTIPLYVHLGEILTCVVAISVVGMGPVMQLMR